MNVKLSGAKIKEHNFYSSQEHRPTTYNKNTMRAY